MEYYTASQVARELNLDLDIVRKLSKSIEKVTMKPQYFLRDNKNRRLYSADNMNEFEWIKVSKSESDKSYMSIIYDIYGRGTRFFEDALPTGKTVEIEKELVEQTAMIRAQNEKMEYITGLLDIVVAEVRENKKKISQIQGIVSSTKSQDLSKPRREDVYELELRQGRSKKKSSLIKREEFKLMRKKVKHLFFRWEEYGKYLYLNEKDAVFYTQYVCESKEFFQQLVHLKKLGKYYVIKTEIKEKLKCYADFYDSLDNRSSNEDSSIQLIEARVESKGR